jgi:hypothetical protein
MRTSGHATAPKITFVRVIALQPGRRPPQSACIFALAYSTQKVRSLFLVPDGSTRCKLWRERPQIPSHRENDASETRDHTQEEFQAKVRYIRLPHKFPFFGRTGFRWLPCLPCWPVLAVR